MTRGDIKTYTPSMRLAPTPPLNWLSGREMAALPNAPCRTALLFHFVPPARPGGRATRVSACHHVDDGCSPRWSFTGCAFADVAREFRGKAR
jgi:hypothetical protein